MYKSLKDFYSAAEFFPAGKIVPRRILKVDSKLSHRFKFGSDTWFVRLPKGHFLLGDNIRPNSLGCVIKGIGSFNQKKMLKIKLCPYVVGGESCFALTSSFVTTLTASDPYASERALLSFINNVVETYS